MEKNIMKEEAMGQEGEVTAPKALEAVEQPVLLEAVLSKERLAATGEDKPRNIKPTPWPFLKMLGRKYFRFVVGSVVVVILILLAYTQKGLVVAALVNGSPISRMSIVQELEKQSGKQALDAVITKKLIATEIKKQNIVVETVDIDAEIKKIEAQVAGQGGTLAQALAQQGVTEEALREQIMIQKELEILLADQVVVSDDEITEYLKGNTTIPVNGTSSDDVKNQVREQLKGQKFSAVANTWISALKAQATIDYFVSYGE